MIYMLYILCCYISLSFLHQLCYRRERVHFLSNWFRRFRKQSMFVMFQCVFRKFLLFLIYILPMPFLERRWFAGSVFLICYDTGKKFVKNYWNREKTSAFVNTRDIILRLHRNSSTRNLFFWTNDFFCRLNVTTQCIYLKNLSLVRPNDIFGNNC